MSITLNQEQDGKIVTIQATGKLTKQDYEQFVPQVEQSIKTFGKIRMVFTMKDCFSKLVKANWKVHING